MTHKEITEQSKNSCCLQESNCLVPKVMMLLRLLKLRKTSIRLVEPSPITIYKSKLGLFEATVSKYYLGRVMPTSVPEEYRNSLKDFFIKYVSMLEEECLELTNAGVRNVAGTFLNLEIDALRSIHDFRNKCAELNERQISVLELVIKRSIQSGEIKASIIPAVIAEMLMNVVIGQTHRSNIEGLLYYTDGMLRQFNSIYRLISSN